MEAKMSEMTREEVQKVVSRGGSLMGIDLSGADLSDTNLTCANLFGANLTCAGLIRSDLTGANLNNTDLSGAVLLGAKMTNISMKNAKCDGTLFPPHILPILPALLAGARNTLLDPEEKKELGDYQWDVLLYSRVI